MRVCVCVRETRVRRYKGLAARAREGMAAAEKKGEAFSMSSFVADVAKETEVEFKATDKHVFARATRK